MNDTVIHLGSKLDPAVLDAIADIICGDNGERYPEYRSSTYLTKFFKDAGINATHDGSTRKWWTLSILEQLTPSDIERVILRLASLKEYKGVIDKLKLAINELNNALAMDNLKVTYINNSPQIVRAKPFSINDDTLSSIKSSSEEEFLEKNLVKR